MANIENIKKWVEALRGGEYQQCTKHLFNGHGYCCLGVVCVLAGIEPVTTDEGFLFHNREGVLPQAAQEWLGIGEPNPELVNGFACTELNDEQKLSFAEIADHIEITYLREAENAKA